jgi:hypothetical protein
MNGSSGVCAGLNAEKVSSANALSRIGRGISLPAHVTYEDHSDVANGGPSSTCLATRRASDSKDFVASGYKPGVDIVAVPDKLGEESRVRRSRARAWRVGGRQLGSHDLLCAALQRRVRPRLRTLTAQRLEDELDQMGKLPGTGLACHDLVKRTANDLALLLLGEEHGRLAWRNPIPALLDTICPRKRASQELNYSAVTCGGARAASHVFFRSEIRKPWKACERRTLRREFLFAVLDEEW